VEQYEGARKRAYEKRPELAELRNRLGLYTELVKVAGAGNKPRLDLKATAGYNDLILGHKDNEYDGKTWSVALAITFPFFDGFRTKGKVAQARSDVSSLKIDEAKLLDSISLQIRDTVNAVKEAGDIARGLAGTVSQAEKLLQMAEKGYEYGVKTRLEVEDAELNLSRARGNLARAYRDYLVAKITLTWAMGILGE
jgi:HAE1 family hydrophobic/amphiphilic exporter-1